MLNRSTSEDVIVEVTITNGSAKGIYVSDLLIVDLQDYLFYYFTAGIDYDISPPMKNNNVTITAGMTSSSFSVDIIDNMLQDGDKMFTITIRPLSTCLTLPVIVDSDTTMVTISDNEGIANYIM